MGSSASGSGLSSAKSSLPRPAPLPSAEIRPVAPAVRGPTSESSARPLAHPLGHRVSASQHEGTSRSSSFTPSAPSLVSAPLNHKSASAFATARRPSVPLHSGSSAGAGTGSVSGFVAPWNHTRSKFSTDETPITALPRIPPPTSTTLLRPPPPIVPTPAPIPAVDPSQLSSLADKTSRQTRDRDRSDGGSDRSHPTPTTSRRVQHDPLGVLP